MKTVDILRHIPLFSELSEEELQKVKAITTKRTYKKKEYVFMEGDKREAVFFIQSGAIKTFKVDQEGNEQIMNLLREGEMFPHIGFFDESPYPATAEVIQEAELFVIRMDDFEALMLNQPQIAVKVMKIMGQKISALAQRIQALISQDVRHRVIFSLIRLALESGKQTEKGVHIDMPITNQDFANIVGSSRETVNRIFNQLKKENLIEFGKNGILINDIDELKTSWDHPVTFS